MNTIQKEELDRLERLFRAESQGSEQGSHDTSVESNLLLQVRLLSFAAIGFAVFAVCNPIGYNLFLSALLVMVLGAFYIVAKCYEMKSSGKSGFKAWLPESNTIKLLGMLAVFGVGYLAAVAPQEFEKRNNSNTESPRAATFITNLFDAFNDTSLHDTNLGTTEVGSKLPGLSLEKSLITGHVDANSLTSALYWNITFNNTNERPQEARARLVLPEGGTVSRATLWVNGIAQEAAFDSTSKVQGAYQWIVQRGRDPLLITQTEEGEVFVQAYPVPAHGKMQLRIGITSPLQAQSRTDFELMAPQIASSNFEHSNLVSAVKLESNAKIDSTLEGEKIKERGSKSILTVDLKSADQEDAKFTVHRARPFKLFATRATHSAEKSFIVEQLVESNSGNLELTTLKTQTMPTVTVAYDFPTASRVSTLWAKQEARKCVDMGDIETAGKLGSAYRIVTAATGATVLESQTDYDHNGLDRDFYKVISASTASESRGNSSQLLPIELQSSRYNTGGQTEQIVEGAAPILQGASNGTIGPQGGDATTIMGINTAGTIRVNNLANLEWLLNKLCLCATWFFCLAATISLVRSFFGTALSKSKNMIAGASFLILGLTVSSTVSWLVGALRDANLFS